MEESEDLAWSDSARTSVALQVSGLILSTTLMSADWGLPLVTFYASLTAATQRNRRSLAAPFQVLLCSLIPHMKLWPFALCIFLSENLLWRAQTVDLVSAAFPRFQKHLFATIIIGTAWGMPILYDAAESLENQASTAITLEDGFYQQFAGALLYGGTVLLLSVSVAVWVRMYRVHPELFRLLLAVAATGGVAGIIARFAGEPDRDVLTAASCCSFVAMAYCVLPDRRTPHLIALLALFLHFASTKLARPHFALLCFSAQLLVKLLFAFQLHTLGTRAPRHTPRISSPLLSFLFPATTA